ncbi:MAG: hypothetical protein AAFP89_02355 [Bacteroidota bacterium]
MKNPFQPEVTLIHVKGRLGHLSLDEEQAQAMFEVLEKFQPLFSKLSCWELIDILLDQYQEILQEAQFALFEKDMQMQRELCIDYFKQFNSTREGLLPKDVLNNPFQDPLYQKVLPKLKQQHLLSPLVIPDTPQYHFIRQRVASLKLDYQKWWKKREMSIYQDHYRFYQRYCPTILKWELTLLERQKWFANALDYIYDNESFMRETVHLLFPETKGQPTVLPYVTTYLGIWKQELKQVHSQDSFDSQAGHTVYTLRPPLKIHTTFTLLDLHYMLQRIIMPDNILEALP